MPQNKIINIYGPTITNKTGLAIYIAKYIWGKYNKEPILINADSRKIYKDLNIGQVKIASPWDKKLVLQLNKFLPLNRKFTLKEYKVECERVIDKALLENKLPIMVGGTGVYHLSVIDNWDVNNDDVRDPFKVRTKKDTKYDSLVLVPYMQRHSIYNAVKKHIEGHFKAGLYKEVKELSRKYGVFDNKGKYNVMLETIGYREFFEYCERNNVELEGLGNKALSIIQTNMFSNLKDMVRKQIRMSDNFKDYKIIENFDDSKALIDKFLSYN